jgi:hypothetical protein
MYRTSSATNKFLSGAALVLTGAAACATAASVASVATTTAPPPAIVLLAVPASPESTLVLAKFALGEVDGTLQAIQWRQNAAVLSTRYTRNHRGVGMSEIAIVAAVGRQVADSTRPLTLVEVRAWAMDSLAQRRQMGAPITNTGTVTHRPRPITLSDSTDWSSVETVLVVFEKHGARRLP